MAGKQYKALKNFQGQSTAISERDSLNHATICKNFDSNVELGKLVSRGGSATKMDTAAANVDKFVAYRDEQESKDVLLVYDKHGTVASRQITLYQRTSGTTGNYLKGSSYSYGNLEFGDDINFLVEKDGVRIGTGTGANNKALYAGYIDRSVGGRHDAMFNDAIAFDDFFLVKQQWVQQADQISACRKVRWDSTRSKFYCLTRRGLEIRDTDWHIEQVFSDVCAFHSSSSSNDKWLGGGVEIIGNNLYVMGYVPELDGSSNVETKILYYQMDKGYEIGAQVVSKTDATGDKMLGITTDGTQIFLVWTDSTDGHLDIYDSDLTVDTAKAYTGAGDTDLWDVTALGSYAYIMDDSNKQVVQVETSAHTTATWATGKTGDMASIENDGVELTIVEWDDPSTKIYNVTINGTFASSSISNTETLTSQECYDHSVTNSIVPYVFRFDTHQILQYTDTNWALAKMLPGKISLAGPLSFAEPATVGSISTHFYGVSVIDIDNQEHHLMSGMAINVPEPIVPNIYTLKIVVSAQSELYDDDHSSPSSGETVQNSIWSDFRRIKTIRLYRAFATGWGQTEPTSNYFFVEDVDINDPRWSEDNANFEYSIVLPVVLDNTELSTTTFEQSSDLPEVFKPYYTNWLHGVEQGGNFYYGNMRTDELNVHQVLQTPLYSPDVAYQLDTNVEIFGSGDGDQIMGFAPSWSRLVVFKGQRSAIYRGLNTEVTYDIGTPASNSIVAHNNTVYFVYDKSIYTMTPSGYTKISHPVDTNLDSETSSNVSGCSAVVFKSKQKIWFQIPSSDTYLYNYNTNTWDTYDLQTGSIDQIYVSSGVDGEILSLNANDDIVYLQNSGSDDAGTDFSVHYQSNVLTMGNGFEDGEIYRVVMTYSSGETIAVVVNYLNRNGAASETLTFPVNTTGRPRQMFPSGIWGSSAHFTIFEEIAAEIRIDMLGIEYSNTEAMINA